MAAGRGMDAVALLEVLASGNHTAHALARTDADPKPGAAPAYDDAGRLDSDLHQWRPAS